MILPIGNNQPTFCKYSIIQIPKNIFVDPVNCKTIEKELIKLSKNAGKEKNIFKQIQNFFSGKKNYPKFESFIEQPFYANIMNYLEANKNCSLEWLNLHTGVKTAPPLKENYYSYILLTGQDADILTDVSFDKDSLQYKRENIVSKLTKHIHEGKVLDAITIITHMNHEFNEDFKALFTGVKPDTYNVNSFAEFSSIVRKIFRENT